jgi:CHAT domain-containing protein/tetratricopeptide (TPR) repeat protein
MAASVLSILALGFVSLQCWAGPHSKSILLVSASLSIYSDPVPGLLFSSSNDPAGPSSYQLLLRNKAEQSRTTAMALARKQTHDDLAQAITQYQESARLFRMGRFNTDEAAVYLRMGEIYFIWSKYKQALRFYRLAHRLSSDPGIDIKCSALSHIAIAYVTVGDIRQSLHYSGQAMTLSNRTANIQCKAEASEAQGEGLLYSKNLEKALKLFSSVIDISKKTGDMKLEAQARLNSGYGLLETGSVEEAFRQQREALRLWTSVGNIHGAAQTHLAMALLLATAGEPDDAVAEYHLAQEIFHKIGDLDSEAVTLNGLGVVSRDLGNYQDALQSHNEAKTIFIKISDKIGEIAAMDGAARAHWELLQYREAESLYRTKLRLAQQAGYYRLQASALSQLADVYRLQHNYGKAQSFYLKALALYRSVKQVFGEIEVLTLLSRLYLEKGQPQESLRLLNEALPISKATHQVSSITKVHAEAASVYSNLRDLPRAQKEIEIAIPLIESFRKKVSSIDDRASYFASVHEYYQIYIDVLMQLHRQHPDRDFAQQAFEKSEKSKVRSLLDTLAGTGINSKCTHNLEMVLHQFGNDLQPLDPARDIDDCASSPPTALNLSQIQAEIRGDDAVLLEYALGKERSYVWVVDEERALSYELPGSTRLSQLVTEYRKALTALQPRAGESAQTYGKRAAQTDKVYEATSQDLAWVLLEPIAHRLNKRRIIIVPDGCLRYIPFAALPLGSRTQNGRLVTLADQYELTSLPSVSMLKLVRDNAEKRPPSTELAAVFADPVFDKDDSRVLVSTAPSQRPSTPSKVIGSVLRYVKPGAISISRLPASQAEAQAILEIMSKEKTFLATGFKASRSTVMDGNLGQYRFIHFATHGLLDTQHPELSGLVLSLVDEQGKPQDGYLRPKEIAQLKLSADLVVLSACDSALGKDLESEGIMGLSRAFLNAGSKSVISSLWKVDDAATATLMQYFYRRIHDGETPAAALRGAQSDLSQKNDWRHPYYWAAFILQGEYR